jgi:hypothetical protein
MATTTQTNPSQVRKIHIYGLVSQGDGTYRLTCDRIADDCDLDTVEEYRECFGDIYDAQRFEVADEGRPTVHAWDDAWTYVPILDLKTGEVNHTVLVPMWEDR